MKMITGGYNLSSINFDLSEEVPEFSIEYAAAQEDLSTILVLLNQPIDANQEFDTSDFSVFVNSEEFNINNIELDEENSQVLYINLDEDYNFLDEILINFQNDQEILSTFNQYLEVFTNFPVYNNITERILIPGQIEAEDFIYQEGLSLEETSDFNGGLNIGYTDSGDFADYLILVTESGEYEVNFRLAAENQSGIISLELIDGSQVQILTQISTPITGGWQSWETVSSTVFLEEGSYKLRMRILQPGLI